MSIQIHPTSDVQTKHVGDGTKVWQFCVILKEAIIGSNCNICSHCFIENQVVIGDNVTIKNSVCLYDGIVIEDCAFIGPNVTFTNDFYPQSLAGQSRQPVKFPVTRIATGASVGGGVTIIPGISIGKRALIGAGAVVTKDVPEYAVVVGQGAVIRRFLTP